MFRELQSFITSSSNWQSQRQLGLGLLVCLLLSGCSDRPPVYPVSGHVVMNNGQPIRSGILEFRNVEMKLNARARIQSDGTYQLTTFDKGDGAVAGEHQAIVVQQVFVETKKPREPMAGQESQPQEHNEHTRVDPQFSRYETSPLVYQVEAKEKNVINIRVF